MEGEPSHWAMPSVSATGDAVRSGTNREVAVGMTTAIRTTDIEVAILCASDLVSADVRDRRPECISLFGDLTPGQRDRLAEDAWRIGLHAIHNARASAQESRLQEIGTALVADIDRQLRDHVEGQQKTIAAVMAPKRTPASWRFSPAPSSASRSPKR